MPLRLRRRRPVFASVPRRIRQCLHRRTAVAMAHPWQLDVTHLPHGAVADDLRNETVRTIPRRLRTRAILEQRLPCTAILESNAWGLRQGAGTAGRGDVPRRRCAPANAAPTSFHKAQTDLVCGADMPRPLRSRIGRL